MTLHVHDTPDEANDAAAGRLAATLASPATCNVMVAAGNTPLELYARIAARGLPLARLQVFMLDEYVGVPPDEPRNCANLLRRHVAEAWGIPPERYLTVSSDADIALASILAHERRITEAGGLDVVILGLGQNGHLGFNEPGSRADSTARLVPLAPISVEANRAWFGGKYAPATGATIGLATLLAARQVFVLAFGPHKTAAVRSMVLDPPGESCPAAFLQGHPDTHLFLDAASASALNRSRTG